MKLNYWRCLHHIYHLSRALKPEGRASVDVQHAGKFIFGKAGIDFVLFEIDSIIVDSFVTIMEIFLSECNTSSAYSW